jgi:hypothetical protein
MDGGLATPSFWWNATSKYVDGGPFTSFREHFYTDRAWLYMALEIDVLTGYDQYAAAADVLVNGYSIGTIPPRPFPTYTDAQRFSLFFDGSWLVPPPGPHTGTQELRIIPSSSLNWVYVGNWWVLYQRG